jgi:transcriptional regulator with XRE-family HTH domain
MGLAPPPTPSPSGSASARAARRAQLADFLKARRAAITPADAGLPVRGHRRTPGLRREEVAQRAGVGLSWYTWLEQARDITPSAQVLLALARALELSAPEQAHLFLLAGVALPEGPDQPENEVDEETTALVHALRPHIAYVLGPRFDILVHNRAAEIIMADLVSRPPGRRNLLLWLFDDETDWSGRGPEWEATARANLMDFRTEFARHPDDPSYQRLVDELTRSSEVLRTWWAEHAVQAPEPVRKRIRHATLGPLDLLQSQSALAHNPSLRLRILVPADDRTRRILASFHSE